MQPLQIQAAIFPTEEEPKLYLSATDRGQIERLKVANVLRPVERHQILAPRGFMTFLCPDCDQFNDKIEFLFSVVGHSCNLRRIHPFGLHGGGLLIAPSSPISIGSVDEKLTYEQAIMVHQIKAAMKMKNLDILVMGCHAPCGAAYGVPVDVFNLFRHTFEAKQWLKQQIPGLRVAVFPHIDYSDGNGNDGKKRTYSISGKDFWEFANRERIFVA